ncbi:MAG: VapC toxin family PIN domain ribonuclease [Candidatus Latescibacteria bacterium]|nr:VapC toxin family PIN domain ribonuclease [Candidatus Latescibacterota bacterium]
MVLVDTSVWITHLRQGQPDLVGLLEAAAVVCHPFVVGELACGHLQDRQVFLTSLQALPALGTVHQDELLYFIDHHRLMGAGIGLVDMHLLAASRLAGVPLWTQDKGLQGAAHRLGQAYDPQ